MKKSGYTVLFAFLCLVLAACSGSQDTDEQEKSRIDQFTDQVARDAVDGIQRPIDKARNVRDRSQQRMQDLPQD